MLKPPTNYSGSKHELLPELIKYFPKKEDVKTFYDVFAGGLSVSINTDYNNIISNDVIEPLIRFYKIISLASKENKIDEEINKILSFKIDKTSKEQFNSVRSKFNETRDPYLFFALVSSCTNNLMRFNKSMGFNQTFGERSINDKTVEKLRSYMNKMMDKNIQLYSFDFETLLKTIPPTIDDFIYFDPPYSITEAGYNAYWTKDSDNKLFNIMDSLDKQGIKFAYSNVSIHKGKENPDMEFLSKYKIINIEHSYEKVARKKDVGKTQEILVINY
jgi:DNA adenine methylase Dam